MANCRRRLGLRLVITTKFDKLDTQGTKLRFQIARQMSKGAFLGARVPKTKGVLSTSDAQVSKVSNCLKAWQTL